jgi:hypothetical protein
MDGPVSLMFWNTENQRRIRIGLASGKRKTVRRWVYERTPGRSWDEGACLRFRAAFGGLGGSVQ